MKRPVEADPGKEAGKPSFPTDLANTGRPTKVESSAADAESG